MAEYVDTNISEGVRAIRRPSIETPEQSQFVEITRKGGLQLGSRWAAPGEVFAITPDREMTRAIMPVDDRLSPTRARDLIAKGFARAHPGPATHECKGKPPFETIGGMIEAAVATPTQKGAERAVSPRQKAGGAV